MPPAPATEKPVRPPGIDLKRHLALRVTLFACLIGLGASAFVIDHSTRRIGEHVRLSGPTVEQLIGRELDTPRDGFDRSADGLALALPDALGRLLRLCIEVHTFYANQSRQRCYPDASDTAPAAVRALLAWQLGDAARHAGPIRQYPGITVGHVTVTPDLDSEAAALWQQLRLVLAISAGVLLLNLLIYLPVRRALRPTERVLDTLRRLEHGDLTARMPRPALVELRRIAEGFDHLAERLQRTDRRQRQLAQRLLTVREQERRRLARELHDEFGQSLASIRAEAACAADAPPAERAAAIDAIARSTAVMMDNLQRILHQLRPVGLEEFGLRASLTQLADTARRHHPACRIDLHLADDIDRLPDALTVSLYRIAQEGLSNALRHGAPRQIRLALERDAHGIALTVEDDGTSGAQDTRGSGLGVLGMTERVEALGGHFSLTPRQPCGMTLHAGFPPSALTHGDPADEHPPAAGR